MTVFVNGVSYPIDSGLISGAMLHELAGQNLLYSVDGTVIPIFSEDYLLIRGGERFILEKEKIKDSPSLQDPLKPSFNDAHDVALMTPKIIAKDLKAYDPEFPDGRLFAEISDDIHVEIGDDLRLIVQSGDSYFVIPPGDFGGVIDIEKCGSHGRKVPKGGIYLYRLDHGYHRSEDQKIRGIDILAQAGKKIEEWSLNLKLSGGKRIKIDEDWIDLTKSGSERFESVRRHAQQGG